ncbi:MAG TPA: hypothetical protein VEA41_12450 [Salinarimonas sp.]|nr:hypothetical protein [Salinarimonas sp.]
MRVISKMERLVLGENEKHLEAEVFYDADGLILSVFVAGVSLSAEVIRRIGFALTIRDRRPCCPDHGYHDGIGMYGGCGTCSPRETAIDNDFCPIT